MYPKIVPFSGGGLEGQDRNTLETSLKVSFFSRVQRHGGRADYSTAKRDRQPPQKEAAGAVRSINLQEGEHGGATMKRPLF